MVVRKLSLSAPAKINLYLKITGRRPDGYHELNTLMQKIALFDELELTLQSQPGINLSCPAADLPEDEQNIVYRAARLFLDHVGMGGEGLRIVLKKNIPIAAGLGGGSSDAAAVLTGLDRMLATGCSRAQLADMGVKLGADVPFFIYEMSAGWATGIGEKLEAAPPLAGYTILLVNPGIAVSTKWAYETFALTSGKKNFSLSRSQKERGQAERFAPLNKRPFQPQELMNDLEAVTADKFGAIKTLKKRLLAAGAAGALMSGSGSTVFGLFAAEQQFQAELCCQELQKEYSQVYLVDPLV